MGNKKKYHMIRWDALDKPKEFGGLGFIDTRAMNYALLCKWIFKLENVDNSIGLNLLRRKYLRGKGFCQSKSTGGSQFWQGSHSVKSWNERGKGHLVRSGRQTRFWKDVWLDECPLSVSFPRIFRVCRDRDISVALAGVSDWNLSIRRAFGETEMKEWSELREKLAAVNLSDEDDGVTWKLEPSGKFTSRSTYRQITFGGVVDVRMMAIWNAKIPLKVQIFLWMAWHNRIQTTDQLRRRNWEGSKDCSFCLKEENVDHLLFQCPIALAIWCWVRDSLNWVKIPVSVKSFQSLLLANDGEGDTSLIWWVMAAVGWSLWKTRNDLVFSSIVIKTPKQVAYKVLGFLKQWSRH